MSNDAKIHERALQLLGRKIDEQLDNEQLLNGESRGKERLEVSAILQEPPAVAKRSTHEEEEGMAGPAAELPDDMHYSAPQVATKRGPSLQQTTTRSQGSTTRSPGSNRTKQAPPHFKGPIVPVSKRYHAITLDMMSGSPRSTRSNSGDSTRTLEGQGSPADNGRASNSKQLYKMRSRMAKLKEANLEMATALLKKEVEYQERGLRYSGLQRQLMQATTRARNLQDELQRVSQAREQQNASLRQQLSKTSELLSTSVASQKQTEGKLKAIEKDAKERLSMARNFIEQATSRLRLADKRCAEMKRSLVEARAYKLHTLVGRVSPMRYLLMHTHPRTCMHPPTLTFRTTSAPISDRVDISAARAAPETNHSASAGAKRRSFLRSVDECDPYIL